MSEQNTEPVIVDTEPTADEKIAFIAEEFDKLEQRVLYLEKILRHEHGKDGKVLFPVD